MLIKELLNYLYASAVCMYVYGGAKVYTRSVGKKGSRRYDKRSPCRRRHVRLCISRCCDSVSVFDPWMMTYAQEQELLVDHDDNGVRRMSVRVPI